MSEVPLDEARLTALRWSVCPGSGRVAHFGGAVVVAIPESIGQLTFVDTLLAVVERAAGESPTSATVLFRDLSGLVIDTRVEAVAPFGVLAEDGDQLAVLLCGSVTLDWQPVDGERERLSASAAMTYLDRRVPARLEWLLLAGAGAAAPDPGSDLRLGVATGTGLSASAQSRPSSGASSSAWAPPAADAAPPRPADAAQPAWLPPVPAPPVRRGPTNVVLTVQGFSPALLARDVVVGRQPERTADVESGAADPFTINDSSVSRVHARLSIDDAGVWLTDLGAVNGTRLLLPGAPAWDVAAPQVATPLEPGTRLLFGAREAVCDFTSSRPVTVPAPPPTSEPAAGGATGPAGGIADYAFVESLGASYHGKTYLARPPTRLGLDAEFVVVKVIEGISSDDAFGRAVRELRAFSSVESPYLLSVYDAGNDAGVFFYSVPHMPRGSLATVGSALPAAEVLRAVAQAARATHALHERGILHLAIAPSAILLGADNAYLADVGATQSIARQQTMSGSSFLQQVEFLEPKILLGGRGTPASDIWSLGATLYRTLSGVSIYGAFPAEPLLGVRTALASSPTLPVELDQGVMALVRRCVGDDATERFGSALELAEALEVTLDR